MGEVEKSNGMWGRHDTGTKDEEREKINQLG